MPRQAIGNTNVGIYSPLSILIDGSASYSMDYVRLYTYPTQNQAGANVGDYAQAAGQFLFQLQIRSSNGARGYVNINYPFGISSSGTNFIGGDRQVYSYTYGYIDISATATYPFNFQYWEKSAGDTYSSTNNLQIYYDNTLIVNNNTLTAVFG